MEQSRRGLLAAAAAGLAGCSAAPGGGTVTTPDGDATVTPAGEGYAYTTLRASGNRLVGGSGSLPDADPVALPASEPAWLLARPTDAGSAWVVVERDGTASAFHVRNGGAEPLPVAPDSLPGGMPPVLTLADGTPRLVAPPEGVSPLTCPAVLDDGALLFVTEDGDVARLDPDGARESVAVDALPDARVVLGGERAYVLGGATGRYGHGVLGDATEAGSLVVLDTAEGLSVARETSIPAPAVVEGIAPIAGRLAGERAVVTESDRAEGARVVAYGPDGERVASGPPVGRGFRWRHQLAVAPFGPGGEQELAAVLTPHIGGTAEFYREREGDLERVATLSGYSSHTVGSRNLDGGLAGDLDGDGRVELLVPTNARTELAALRRTEGGVTEAWRLPVGGRLATNVFGLALAEGGIAVGAGHAGGVRVWAA